MTKLLISVCILLLSTNVFADKKSEIATFEKNAQTCQHLAGEWDSTLSPKEKRNIEKSIDKYCLAAKKQMQILKKNYKNDNKLDEKLIEYEFLEDFSPQPAK